MLLISTMMVTKTYGHNKSDALSSAAHYLSRHGWQMGGTDCNGSKHQTMVSIIVLLKTRKKLVSEWLELGITQMPKS